MEQFKPAWWLPEGHSQTLWRKFTYRSSLQRQRQRVELDDGDFIDIDWALKPSASATKPITIILHGLCGCSSSPYVIALQKLLTENAVPNVAMNFRGCSGEVNRLARAYHSGATDDLQQVVSVIEKTYPNAAFSLVGYSLGANVLLKWLGEDEPPAEIRCAIAISPPFQLAHCSKSMLSGPGSIYGNYFFKQLSAELNAKKDHFTLLGIDSEMRTLASLPQLEANHTLWDFDDFVTAPLHGFANAQDYYDQCSSGNYLDSNSTSTLIIHSRNDPIIPAAVIPVASAVPSNIKLEVYTKGGHVGFISGMGNNWLERRILAEIASRL